MCGLDSKTTLAAKGYANDARIPGPVARFLTLSKYERGRSPAAAEAKPCLGALSMASL